MSDKTKRRLKQGILLFFIIACVAWLGYFYIIFSPNGSSDQQCTSDECSAENNESGDTFNNNNVDSFNVNHSEDDFNQIKPLPEKDGKSYQTLPEFEVDDSESETGYGGHGGSGDIFLPEDDEMAGRFSNPTTKIIDKGFSKNWLSKSDVLYFEFGTENVNVEDSSSGSSSTGRESSRSTEQGSITETSTTSEKIRNGKTSNSDEKTSTGYFFLTYQTTNQLNESSVTEDDMELGEGSLEKLSNSSVIDSTELTNG